MKQITEGNTMFETIKNAFIDKDNSNIKFGSIIAAAAGVLTGSLMLAPALTALPLIGGMAGLLAPIAGAAAFVYAKEAFFPSSGGGQQAQHTDPAPSGQDTQAHGHGQGRHMEPEVPNNLPNHGPERER
jgi:hypothetical protein